MAYISRSTLYEYLVVIIIGILTGISVSLFYIFFEYIWNVTKVIVSIIKYLALIIVPLGILISYLIVEKIAKVRRTGCGTHGVLEAYFAHNGFIHPNDIVSKTIASALTMGFGGSAGPEGPSMLIGGGIASYISRKLNIEISKLRRFFIAGSAAGISAVFRAPLTGILFALEIPYRRDIEGEAFIEAVIASITAYAIFILINGPERIFKVELTHLYLSPIHLLCIIILGIFSAFIAYIFVKMYHFFRHINNVLSLRIRGFIIPILGGVIIALLSLLDIRVLGPGYEIIHTIGYGESLGPLYIILILLILKMVSTCLTLGFGGSGGLFIPTLVIGAISSEIFIETLNIKPTFIVTAAGMAAVLAASSKTPLTAIAFVAETCGPMTIIPASIAAIISYILTGNLSLFELQPPHKLAEEELALDAIYLRVMEVDPMIPRKIKAYQVMNPKPVTLREDETVEDVLGRVKDYTIRVYPIVDKSWRIKGVVYLEDILAVEEEQIKMKLIKLARRAVTAHPYDELRKIMMLMAENEVDHIFIVDEEDKLLGVIAEIDVVRFLANELYRIWRRK